jgi:hypothetical protein
MYNGMDLPGGMHLEVEHCIVDRNQADPPLGPMESAGTPHVSDANHIGRAHGHQTQAYAYGTQMDDSIFKFVLASCTTGLHDTEPLYKQLTGQHDVIHSKVAPSEPVVSILDRLQDELRNEQHDAKPNDDLQCAYKPLPKGPHSVHSVAVVAHLPSDK